MALIEIISQNQNHMTRSHTSTRSLFLSAAVIGMLGLSLFYFLLLWAVTGDITHPWSQFIELQPWMSLLIVGFGVQVGLYWLLKKGVQFNLSKSHQVDANVMAGTSATMSGVSMAACCAHHVVDVLPILGVTGAAFFLTQYQTELLIVGVLANAIGVISMLWMLYGKAKPAQIWQALFIR